MKLETKTSKLYYGFPVILIGYKDKKWRYNVTACSSSYSLGDMITVGLSTDSNAVENIREYGEFTVNVPDMTYDPAKYIDAPIMDECILSLECKVESVLEYGKYTNFVASIKRRVVCENLLDEEGNMKYTQFNPIYFMGDDNKRVYRYFNEQSKNHGENMGCSSDEDEYNPLCG